MYSTKSEKREANPGVVVLCCQRSKRFKNMLQKAHDYHNGLNGVNIDDVKAVQIYEEIEKEGGKLDGNALCILGNMCELGYGMSRNGEKAKLYYARAAEYYNERKNEELTPVDWNNIGKMYLHGHAYKSDVVKGTKLLKKAVKLGCPLAMLNLGRMYVEGVWVEQDHKKAYELFIRSVEKSGLVWAIICLAYMHENGLGLERADKTKASELYLKAAQKNERKAMYSVGVLFYNEDDRELARMWWERAAALGDLDAMRDLEEIIATDLEEHRLKRIDHMCVEDIEKAVDELLLEDFL